MLPEIEPAPASPAVVRDSYSIEQAGWRDLNALRHLERACFSKDAWPLLDMIGVLALPNVVRLKAVVDGDMVGFIAGDVRPGHRLAWIATLAVLPEYRRRGIGRTLLQTCEEQLKVAQIRLNVRASNQAAVHLYKEAGYQKTGLWKNYYADGEDALVMEKEQ
jgi:ribosomal-protein-alanine N-acetyltransferase